MLLRLGTVTRVHEHTMRYATIAGRCLECTIETTSTLYYEVCKRWLKASNNSDRVLLLVPTVTKQLFCTVHERARWYRIYIFSSNKQQVSTCRLVACPWYKHTYSALLFLTYLYKKGYSRRRRTSMTLLNGTYSEPGVLRTTVRYSFYTLLEISDGVRTENP
jgi:hypothetical protein